MRKKIKKVIKGLEKASKTHAKQAKILKSGLKVLKKRVGGAAGREYGASTSASKAAAASTSATTNRDAFRGSDRGPTPPKNFKPPRSASPGDAKDVPYKSNPMVNILAGAIIPGGGILAEGAQRKAYKDRQKYARKEGLYREYYVGNQYNPDPTKRTLKPNTKEGKAFITEAKPKKVEPPQRPDKDPILCPDGTLPPCEKIAAAPKIQPIGKQTPSPKMFEFNFNQGGLVRGAGKILKDRNRKVRIF